MSLFFKFEGAEVILTLTQIDDFFDVVGWQEGAPPLGTKLVKLSCDLLNKLPLKEICVHCQVLISCPDKLPLRRLHNTRILYTEVKKDLDAGA